MSKFEKIKQELQFQPKTWLVTGVAGFIGSHLLEQLLKLNQRVIGIDNFITGSQINLDEVKKAVPDKVWKNFTFFKGDIRNPKDCEKVFQNVDYVLHQAALGSVPRSIKDPAATNDHNVNGFLNVITFAKDKGVKSFVYASSSSVYGDHPELPKVEEKIGQCLSPYAVSKRVDELYAHVFHVNYKLPVIGLRYFNVFGPRQDPNGPYAAVIPLWLSSMIKNEPVFINGDGSTSRDFCYVQNAVQANILAATCNDHQAFDQVYNVACGDKTSLTQLFEHLRSFLKPKYEHLKAYKANYRDFRAGDIQHSLANISKASKLLGYVPSHKIADGLKEAISWYIAASEQKFKKAI